MNGSAGVDGLVPTLLVLGTMPKCPLPGSDEGESSQTERLAAMTNVLDEYAMIINEQRLQVIQGTREPTNPTDLANEESLRLPPLIQILGR